MKKSYELGKLPLPKDEFLSGHMLRKAVDYRNLVEPLDCANWYHLGIDKQLLLPGIPKGDYPTAHHRPGAYRLICSRQEAAVTTEPLSAASLGPTVEAYEQGLAEISAKCKEARFKRESSQRGCIVM
ncbi:g8592 [Coccomyxa elongata]